MQDICKFLGIKYPVIQGAMGHITNGAMAAAATEAGGLGTIATAEKPLEFVRREYKLARSLTKGPIALNIPFKKSPTDELARFIVDEHVDVVVASAGSPKAYIPDWKKAGVKIASVIATVEHAVKMDQAGVDLIIAEGMESGGRIGYMTTMALLPQVVDAVSVPVVAAGGIADGRGMAAAFQMGASGVQIGTRFLFAEECEIHENYRKLLLEARSSDVVVSGRPHRRGGEARIIRNELYRKSIELEERGASSEEYTQLFEKSFPRAVLEGDVEYGSPMAGQVVGMLHKIQPIAEIIQEIIGEYNALPPLPKIPL